MRALVSTQNPRHSGPEGRQLPEQPANGTKTDADCKDLWASSRLPILVSLLANAFETALPMHLADPR